MHTQGPLNRHGNVPLQQGDAEAGGRWGRSGPDLALSPLAWFRSPPPLMLPQPCSIGPCVNDVAVSSKISQK